MPSPLAVAEAALARGDFAQALAVADQLAESSAARSDSERGRIIALELGLRALARSGALGRAARARRRRACGGGGDGLSHAHVADAGVARARRATPRETGGRARRPRRGPRAARRDGRAHRRPGAPGGVRGRSRCRGGEEANDDEAATAALPRRSACCPSASLTSATSAPAGWRRATRRPSASASRGAG